MKVVSHDDQWVWIELEGKTIQLLRCIDRYTAHANGLGRGGNEVVQIWEDGRGLVIRLSRTTAPDSSWTAEKWV